MAGTPICQAGTNLLGAVMRTTSSSWLIASFNSSMVVVTPCPERLKAGAPRTALKSDDQNAKSASLRAADQV